MPEEEHTGETLSWYAPSATERLASTSSPAERAWPADDGWPAPADAAAVPALHQAPPAAPDVPPPPAHDLQPGGAGWSVRSPRSASPREWEVVAAAGPGIAGAVAGLPWDAPPKRGTASTARRLGFAGVVVVAFALAGVAAVGASSMFHRGPALTQPATVGALTLIAAPGVDTAMQSLPQDLKGEGVTKTVFGLYGAAGGQPQLAFYATQGSTLPSDAPAMRRFYESYATGLRATGFAVDTSAATVMPISGINFVCGPVNAPAPLSMTLSACVWVDGGIAGTVIDLTGQSVPETLNEAVQARTASEH